VGRRDEPLLVVAPVGVGPFVVLVGKEIGRAEFQRPLVLDQGLIALQALSSGEVGVESVDVCAEQACPKRVPLARSDEDLALEIWELHD